MICGMAAQGAELPHMNGAVPCGLQPRHASGHSSAMLQGTADWAGLGHSGAEDGAEAADTRRSAHGLQSSDNS